MLKTIPQIKKNIPQKSPLQEGEREPGSYKAIFCSDERQQKIQ